MTQLISAPNFCVKILSKSLACMMSQSLENEQDVLMALEGSEAKTICEALSSFSINVNVSLPDFYMPLTSKELIMLMKSLCGFAPNMTLFLSEQSLLPTLHTMLSLYENDAIGMKLMFLLLIELSQCPAFGSVQIQFPLSFSEPITKCAHTSDVFLRNILQHCLQKENIPDATIQIFLNNAAKGLSKDFDGSCVDDRNSSMFFSLCDCLDVSCNLLSLSNEGNSMLTSSDIVPALFKAAANLFAGKFH